LIRELGVTTPVYAIKPYTFDFIPDPISDFSNRNDILFVGGFTHLPNVDAVMWFVREVWPQVKQQISGGRFIIAGSNVTPQIVDLANDEIIITGFLSEPDLQNLYKKVKLAVVPLRYGAGVKGKTVEAMYNGIPLVTTTTGIEGLPGTTTFINPKNSSDEFADEVIRLYNAPDQQLIDLSKIETEYVHDHFYFDVVRKELLAIINTLAVKK
jgi:O-antigen biosynthesis protein